MEKYFSTIGNVVDAVVMKDRHTKKSRGFGFVTFEVFGGEGAVKALTDKLI